MPAREPKWVTFEIDGREVRAPEGSMLADGAKFGDVEIPVFCYEPKLGQPVGACRMCLVEIEGMPKLQTACSTAVKDGMVVNTTSERVKSAQTDPAPSMSHGRARKRYAVEVSAPTGHSSTMLPLNGPTYGWPS